MRHQTRFHRRAAAIVALIIVLVIAGLVMLGMVMAGARDQDLAARQAEGSRALYAAQAGINMSFRELIEDADEDGDGTTGGISNDGIIPNNPQIGAANVFVTVADLGGEYMLTSRGNSGQAWRTLRARVTIGEESFGFTQEFDSAQDKVEKKQIATQVTLAEAATVTSMSAYINGPPPKLVRYAIYADGAGEPGTLIVQSANQVISDNTFHWETIDIPDTHLTVGAYWLALAFEHSNMEYAYVGSGGETRYNNHDAVASGYNSPWGVSTTISPQRIAIYASMIPDAGGGVEVLGWDENP